VRCLHPEEWDVVEGERTMAMHDDLAEFLIRRIACAGYQSPDT